ncbi:hypothetical protein RHMOL_Rhmol02G0271800 [Rhododendron molle]|uniref:Uncharacterized protein n=1 Tax=Rhododendron molle TaxID=49168 RepID=A0ACC0PV34_RHOML|nr:hypothetical protein RHMOL_Rhmol02G0271800 [Rhododendron molle]
MHLWLLFEVHLPFPDLFAASFCAVVASGLGVSLSPGSSMTVSVYSADSSGLGALSLRVQHCSALNLGLLFHVSLSKEDALDTKECQESIKGAGFTIVDVDIYSRVSRQIQNCS